MAQDDESASPLLSATRQQDDQQESEESTPLLSRDGSVPRYDGGEERRLSSPAASSLRSIQNGHSTATKKSKTPWAVIISIVLLITTMIIIAFAAFIAPAAVEEYAKQALVIEPTGLSIDSFTADGVKARIQADFKLDASKVKADNVRNIGRFGTWLARKVESQESVVKVYLPEYDNILLGSATVPPVTVNIRDGETTHIDIIASLAPGEVEGIKRIANDWLEGRLGDLRVLGKADVELKSGIFPLGTTSISESLLLEGNDIPSIPAYNITDLKFREVPVRNGGLGVGADAALTIFNDYKVGLTIPPLAFDILVPNCKPDQPHLQLADATTATIDVRPESEVKVQVEGLVKRVSKKLLDRCPGSSQSPLDLLLGSYIHGEDVQIFVKGSNSPSADTPDWIYDIISTIEVAVPFPGHKFDDAIKNFTLEDVHFGFPDPFAAPGSPASDYRVSGNIEVIAAMPKELDLAFNVSQVRANADVFYKGKKLGFLDLKKWQSAKSERIRESPEHEAAIMIQSRIKEAPLRITDDDIFQDMLGEYLIGGKTLMLAIKALVDIKVDTVLGEFVVRDLPGEGNVPVKAPRKGDIGQFLPKIGSLDIVDTTATSLVLEARVNFTNPTQYSAFVRYASIHIENNGTVVGEGIVRNISVVPGENTNILAQAIWDPYKLGGTNGPAVGRELMSRYLSGYNTTLTFRTHRGSIPSQPRFGEALSIFNVTIPTPRLFTPPEEPDTDPKAPEAPHFIRDATFHLFSSTGSFVLLSPLKHATVFVEHINATAFYNHTEPVGRILYDFPFGVPPGASESPRLPVDWSLDSVGYEKVRKALGGQLKLDAVADVGVRLGHWTERIWYEGSGIGAKVRL